MKDWMDDGFLRPKRGGMTRWEMNVAIATTDKTKLAWAIATLGRRIVWLRA